LLTLGINSSFHLLREDSAFGHDAAAVLLEDGSIVAAVEEERLTRVKHTAAFPAEAIRYCLAEARTTLASLDQIAVNGAEKTLDLEVYLYFLAHPGMSWPGGGRDFLNQLFSQHFGAAVRSRLSFCDHHMAHAWSAFACSGFPQSLVITLDGAGDGKAGAVLIGRDQTLTPVAQYSVRESIGMTYWFITQLLGFRHFDEYKVMGLAPWGNPERFGPLFRSLYTLLEGGRYRFADTPTVKQSLRNAGVLEIARRSSDSFTGVKADIAAALQKMTEDICLHIIGHHARTSGQPNLCLAGGVAHNCSMVGKISKTGWFREIFVQPAAHDGGGALGAALWAYRQTNVPHHSRPLKHVYWGPHLGSNDQIETRLKDWSPLVSSEIVADIAGRAARLLAEGHVIGWVQGRSEFGPRALGNRSILADPRPAANTSRINAMIKKREAFRPFAPAVRQEVFSQYFDGAGCERFPYMTVVLDVLENKRELLGAVTHVDGTARVQTVSRGENALFYDLLLNFEQLTGVPILLNTSFNNQAEPIVQTVDEAVACFLTSGLDCLVVGTCLVSKVSLSELKAALLGFVPSIPSHWHLLQWSSVEGAGEQRVHTAIETNPASPDHHRLHEVTPEVFRILQNSDGRRTLSSIVGRPISEAMQLELFHLWTERGLLFRPRQANWDQLQENWESSDRLVAAQ
jgi:carbamoyltransferase